MFVIKRSSMKRSRPGYFGSDALAAVSDSTRVVSFPSQLDDLVQVVCEVPSIMDFHDNERKQLWYSRSDFQLTKSTARVIAQESERYGHSKHLDHVYGLTHPVSSLPPLATCFTEDDGDDNLDRCTQKLRTSVAQDQLNLWALHGHSRRGLERWANSTHGNIRKEDQYRYQQGILRAQQELTVNLRTAACNVGSINVDVDSENGDGNGESPVCHAIMAEMLRQISTTMSENSRRFAQMMGEADAHAAHNGFVAATRTGLGLTPSSMTTGVGMNHNQTQEKVNPPPRRLLGIISDIPRRSMSTSASTAMAGSGTGRQLSNSRFTIRTASRAARTNITTSPSSSSSRMTARMA